MLVNSISTDIESGHFLATLLKISSVESHITFQSFSIENQKGTTAVHSLLP